MQVNKSFNTFIKVSKKYAGGGAKIDPKTKDFDVLFAGGLCSAHTIKWLQVRHFHGKMGIINPNSVFFHEHQYDALISSSIKDFKYKSMPIAANFNVGQSLSIKDRISKILPHEKKVLTEKGETYSYKTLVLNTGLQQNHSNLPFLEQFIKNDPLAHSRVFVQATKDLEQIQRNLRIYQNHKNGDIIIYLPEFPSRRECY